MEITPEIVNSLSVQPYQKTALVRARLLTQEDYIQRQGVIQSLEGPERFQPGEYLAHGVVNEEWITSEKTLVSEYEQVAGPDEEGFITYSPKPVIRYACQIPEPFVVKRSNGRILTGKVGDYLIRLENRARIVDRVVFEQSYRRVDEDRDGTSK